MLEMHVFFEDNARYSDLSERLAGVPSIWKRAVLFSGPVRARALCYLCSGQIGAKGRVCDWCACVPDPMMRTGRSDGLAVVLPEAADMLAIVTLQLFAPDLTVISREPLDLAFICGC
jgi:hypothetical protein